MHSECPVFLKLYLIDVNLQFSLSATGPCVSSIHICTINSSAVTLRMLYFPFKSAQQMVLSRWGGGLIAAAKGHWAGSRPPVAMQNNCLHALSLRCDVQGCNYCWSLRVNFSSLIFKARPFQDIGFVLFGALLLKKCHPKQMVRTLHMFPA